MNFSKYSGLGNDFILVDNRDGHFPSGDQELIRRLCHRRFGIGADGIILLERSQIAQAKMRIFNADGSEAEMCGNGLRCFMQFLLELGFAEGKYAVETLNDVLTCKHTEGEVWVKMSEPSNVCWSVELGKIEVHSLNTGVPHAVHFTADLEKTPLEELGPYVRRHPFFGPEGTNFTVAQVIGEGRLKFRTFERGVEGETYACGTGACAAALAYAHTFQRRAPVVVETMTGGMLLIEFEEKNGLFSSVSMQGPATFVFNGSAPLSEELHRVMISAKKETNGQQIKRPSGSEKSSDSTLHTHDGSVCQV